VAFVVQDGWQGKGLGEMLARGIVEAAHVRGIRRFVAYVLAQNSRMLDLLRRLTDIESRTVADGVVQVVFTRRTPESRPLTRRGG
jgi:GNAT superfamily N-acetyltransferase